MTASADSWMREPFTEGNPLEYTASFDAAELARLKAGLIPRVMEDKWFIYYEEPYLYLHRSWTGLPMYRLKLEALHEGARVVEALRSPHADNPKFDIEWEPQLLEFLIGNLVLGKSLPFPHPGGPDDPPGILQHHHAGTGYPEKPARRQATPRG